MKRIGSTVLMGVALIVSGCASMKEAMEREYCHYEGAYQLGMNDAREDKPMENMSSYCPEAKLAVAAKGYREGYEAGIKSLLPPAGGSSSQRTTNINIGGTQVITNPGTPPAQTPAWFCELSKFGDTFSAFGATKLEAQQSVKTKCLQKHSDIFCNDPTCKRNR